MFPCPGGRRRAGGLWEDPGAEALSGAQGVPPWGPARPLGVWPGSEGRESPAGSDEMWTQRSPHHPGACLPQNCFSGQHVPGSTGPVPPLWAAPCPGLTPSWEPLPHPLFWKGPLSGPCLPWGLSLAPFACGRDTGKGLSPMRELGPGWTRGARTHPLLPRPLSLPSCPRPLAPLSALFLLPSLSQSSPPPGQQPAWAGPGGRGCAGLPATFECQTLVNNRFLLVQVWPMFYLLSVATLPTHEGGGGCQGECRPPPRALSARRGGRQGPSSSSKGPAKVARGNSRAFSAQVSVGNGRPGEGKGGEGKGGEEGPLRGSTRERASGDQLE